MIDVEAESRDVRARSEELVRQLDAAVAAGEAAVDRSGMVAAQQQSRRLLAALNHARAAVIERVRRGEDPGCLLGRKPQIRQVRPTRDGRQPDDDPVLQGRIALTDELDAYWRHRRDEVGPAREDAYQKALAAVPYRPALEAAVQEQLGRLRRRGSSEFEGGAALAAAMNRLTSVRQVLGEESRAGQTISTGAQAKLDQFAGERAAAVLGDLEGTEGISPQLLGRISLALDVPVDAHGRPVGTAATK